MRAVYICHPYSGAPKKNVAKVRKIAREAMTAGVLPLAPHLYFPAFVSEERERATALALCLALVERADELWVYLPKTGKARGRLTAGMQLETDHALRLGKPVFEKEG